MLHRIVRPVLVILLILTGIASAGFLWFSGQRIASAHRAAVLADARVDALLGGLSECRAALQAYVAPGQSVTTWAQRTAALQTQMTDDVAALEGLQDAGPVVAVVRPALATLAKIDGRARDYLRSGDELMAADLAFNEARETSAGATEALRDWRAAQQASAAATVSGIQLQQMVALGAGVLAWALSLLLVWKRPATPVLAAASIETAAPAMPDNSMDMAFPAVPTRSLLDLSVAAQACGALAMASDSAQLKAALGRGAEAIGAKGVVVWLGVGEELFAVASHGYDERHLRRPIARNAQNVTAEAWRTGEGVAVAADGDAPGVLVVPMAGSAGCRGVVSAELLPGRPANTDRQALLSMFAAQLVGVVGAATPATAAAQATATEPATVEQAS